jgi:endonuclease/exonuclease/phosphatase family metal-dependent hydrolase
MSKVLLQRVAIIFLVAVTSFATLGLGTCGAEAGKTLNILTINLMLINPNLLPNDPNAPLDWPNRADKLVSFIHQQEELGQPVDFILCQEGHGGELSKILGGRGNTIRDLKRRLQKAGLTYYVASAVSFQNFQTGGYNYKSNYLVGVLSRYPIKTVKVGKLTCDASAKATPPEPTVRKAIACITKVPAIGRVALFSAHLATACAGEADQGKQLLAFANRVAKNSPADLYILGGDFNADPESALYGYLATNYNLLIDTFAAVNPGDPGYTFAVPGNPYFIGAVPSPRRIDYIFAVYGKQNPGHPTEQSLAVEASRVVLYGPEPEDFMSDHCGVLSRIIVTPPYGGKFLKGIFAPPVLLP